MNKVNQIITDKFSSEIIGEEISSYLQIKKDEVNQRLLGNKMYLENIMISHTSVYDIFYHILTSNFFTSTQEKDNFRNNYKHLSGISSSDGDHFLMIDKFIMNPTPIVISIKREKNNMYISNLNDLSGRKMSAAAEINVLVSS